jgi:RES domain-containing protein
MNVFRITTEKWAGNLKGSGFAARWNSNGIFTCYSASSRALACLEMVVHLNADRLKTPFKITVIEIPDDVEIKTLNTKALPVQWSNHDNYPLCQEIGDNWMQEFESCVLRVPSAIIKNEYNYLINHQHQDFKKLRIVEIEDFEFDVRIKEN